MFTLELVHAWPNEELLLVVIQSRIDSDRALAASVPYLQHTGNVFAFVHIDIQFFVDLNHVIMVLLNVALGSFSVFDLKIVVDKHGETFSHHFVQRR